MITDRELDEELRALERLGLIEIRSMDDRGVSLVVTPQGHRFAASGRKR